MMKGNLLKMKTRYTDAKSPVEYSLPLGENEVPLNKLLGEKIQLQFSGDIHCIATGEKIKKSYNQGYSYKAFSTLARCDLCIVKPELCHYAKGTCREPKWGEENCMIDHFVYVSVSSHLKVGITRHSQLPTRWIDQGASYALTIAKVKDRLTSGLIESEISKNFSDRTNWRAMLKGDIEEIDLEQVREQIYEDYGDILDEYDAEDLDSEVCHICYPIIELPQKIKSLSFDKEQIIEGTLLGIKGQYLIFDIGVLNIRKHQGYFVELSF